MYNRASVFCRPSYSEGLPLTMLEAMASGVPPVVTAIAGVPEVVTDPRNGVLLEPGRSDKIKAAIVELFDDETLRAELARNAREYVVNNLTWSSGRERSATCIKAFSEISPIPLGVRKPIICRRQTVLEDESAT